jgi:hypothetical protein
MGDIKIGDWLSESWELISEDLVTHLILGLIVGYGSAITGSLLWGPLMGGYLWIFFKKLKTPSYSAELGDIGKGFEMFVPTLLVGILVMLITLLGLIGCIIGIFVTAALTALALPYVVEGNRDPMAAISESFAKTKENLVGWIVFIIVIGLIHSLSSVIGGLGYAITFPLNAGMLALAYRDTVGLQGAAATSAPAPSEPAAPAEPSAPSAQPSPTEEPETSDDQSDWMGSESDEDSGSSPTP